MRELADLIYEAGMLKRTPRSGWLTIGVKQPESVAEHVFRATLIGMLLAKLERCDCEKVLKLCIVHDLKESRIGDIHKLAKRYLGVKKPVEAANNELAQLIAEFEAQESKEAIVARDADKLELIAQAREYLELGFKPAKKWIINAKKELRTKSAKKLARELEKTSAFAWVFK